MPRSLIKTGQKLCMACRSEVMVGIKVIKVPEEESHVRNTSDEYFREI
jgi:hypothetical protein